MCKNLIRKLAFTRLSSKEFEVTTQNEDLVRNIVHSFVRNLKSLLLINTPYHISWACIRLTKMILDGLRMLMIVLFLLCDRF